MGDVIEDIRTMPIAVLADVTGLHHILVLEKVRQDFIGFVQQRQRAGHIFMSWPDAWDAYFVYAHRDAEERNH